MIDPTESYIFQLPIGYHPYKLLLHQLSGYLEEKGVEYQWKYFRRSKIEFGIFLYAVPIKVYHELFIPYLREKLIAMPGTWYFYENSKIKDNRSDADILLTIHGEQLEV